MRSARFSAKSRPTTCSAAFSPASASASDHLEPARLTCHHAPPSHGGSMRFIALLIAILLLPCTLLAQPLADRIPNDALFYVGRSGSQNLGPAYDGAHLKGVI